jgi:SAM-dependent methyltransferase
LRLVARYGRAVDLAKSLTRSLVRRASPVTFADVTASEPLSRRFGGDRGGPIDRHYIEQFVRDHCADITGHVLEIGEPRYTRAFGSDVAASDVLHAVEGNPNATLVADLTRRETLPPAAFDCVICTQTLGFIFDVPAAIDGIWHVLRPGGVILATVAGISQVSRYDMDRWGDYWRFTDASVRQLFKRGFGDDVAIRTYGNVSAAIALLQGLAVEDLPDRSVLDRHDSDYQVILAIRARKPA